MTGIRTKNFPEKLLVTDVIVRDEMGTGLMSIGNLKAQLDATPGALYETRAGLYADLAWAAGSVGRVFGDSNTAYRGVYLKLGGVGSGSWTRIGPLPDEAGHGAAIAAETNRALAAEAAGLQRANHLGAQAISTITGLDAELTQETVERIAGDTTSRARSNHTGTQPISTITGLDAELTQETAERQAADAAASTRMDGLSDALIQRQGRPGDAIARFTSTLSGKGSLGAPPPGVVGEDSHGAYLEVTGAGIVATRERIAIWPGSITRLRYSVRRSVNPTDPMGDAIGICVQPLSGTKTPIGAPITVAAPPLSVAANPHRVDIHGSDTDGADIDVVWPANTHYVVAHVETYEGGKTRIYDIEDDDITDVVAAGADVSALAGRVTTAESDIETLDDRIDTSMSRIGALEGLVTDEETDEVAWAVVTQDYDALLEADPYGGLRSARFALASSRVGTYTMPDEDGFVGFGLDLDGSAYLGDMTVSADFPAGWLLLDHDYMEIIRAIGSSVEILGVPVGPPSAQMLSSVAPEVNLATFNYLSRGAVDLPRYRMDRAKVLLGDQGPGTVVWIGDSNLVAWAAEGSGNHRLAKSPPTVLARMLDRTMPTTAASFFGQQITSSSVSAYEAFNASIDLGAGWSIGADMSIGGGMFEVSSGTDPLVFTPGEVWDRARVTVSLGAAASLSLDIGGTATTLTPATGSIQTISYSAPSRGANPLNIRRVSGTVRINGVSVYDSVSPPMRMLNVARSGWRASDWISQAAFYSPGNGVLHLAATASTFVIQLGLNEFNQDIAPSVFQANLATLVGLCRTNGADVVLVVSVQPGGTSAYAWELYRAAIYAVARLHGLPVVDLTLRMGSRAAAEGGGFTTDALHPNQYGYADTASAFHRFFTSF
ncbi:SGNH/GDSL hydrolase family protein [Ensifer soli]|uniref:SGNH/GDSL hydrolase family protein n=1 Tax=Ciceribacter sp. sgz301302 TaxID=3342379 RepID=UPI0035B7F5C5